MFIEGLVTQIMVRAGVPILVNTADRIKSPTLSPGVLMWGVNICQIPHPQGQYFWSIIACVGPGGGGWGFQLTGALERSGRPVSSFILTIVLSGPTSQKALLSRWGATKHHKNHISIKPGKFPFIQNLQGDHTNGFCCRKLD